MTQPEQQPPVEDAQPPEAEGPSLLLPILTAILTYEVGKELAKLPWKTLARNLGLFELAGGALGVIAQRALGVQRQRAGKKAPQLWEHTNKGITAGVSAGVQTMTSVLKRVEASGTQPDQTGIFHLAEDITDAVAAAAQISVAEAAGWKKRWKSKHDLHVRASHAFLSGQTKPAGEPFVTEDGVKMMYPHDPHAPLDEVIGCRCWVEVFSVDR